MLLSWTSLQIYPGGYPLWSASCILKTQVVKESPHQTYQLSTNSCTAAFSIGLQTWANRIFSLLQSYFFSVRKTAAFSFLWTFLRNVHLLSWPLLIFLLLLRPGKPRASVEQDTLICFIFTTKVKGWVCKNALIFALNALLIVCHSKCAGRCFFF